MRNESGPTESLGVVIEPFADSLGNPMETDFPGCTLPTGVALMTLVPGEASVGSLPPAHSGGRWFWLPFHFDPLKLEFHLDGASPDTRGDIFPQDRSQTQGT